MIRAIIIRYTQFDIFCHHQYSNFTQVHCNFYYHIYFMQIEPKISFHFPFRQFYILGLFLFKIECILMIYLKKKCMYRWITFLTVPRVTTHFRCFFHWGFKTAKMKIVTAILTPGKNVILNKFKIGLFIIITSFFIQIL